jgi:hypothetical protein
MHADAAVFQEASTLRKNSTPVKEEAPSRSVSQILRENPVFDEGINAKD